MEMDIFDAELNWWDKLTGSFCRLWWTLCDQWKDFGYRRQRFQRGYASCDVWELRTWFIKTVKPMLQDLSIHRTGCPAELTDEGWGMILDEMVGLLELMDIWDDTAVKEKYAIPGEDTSYETQMQTSCCKRKQQNSSSLCSVSGFGIFGIKEDNMNVEIMSRETLLELAKEPFPEGTSIISITNSEDENVMLDNQPDRMMHLKFDDVSDEIFEELLGRKPNVREMHQIASRFHMLSNAQTQQMADFVLSMRNEGTLICQCEHGQSRSAGVAAAVMEYYYRKGINIFADVRYYPNKHVFRKLLCSLRIRGGRKITTARP